MQRDRIFSDRSTTDATRLDRLYELLPALHRIRDCERGQPLRALLQVIAEQVNLLEDDIERLYENWFIETCDDWVVPYLADLLRHQPVREGGEPRGVTMPADRLRNRILVPRREVANTIRNRRRKGTLALLELLSRDVSGWPARAIEFRNLLVQAVALDRLHLGRGRLADLRKTGGLDRIGTPFDTMAHTIDLRRINSRHAPGRYNLPAVGLFVWRLKAYSVTYAPAYCMEEVGPHCYTFSVLGSDTPLFNRPYDECDPFAIAGELNVPAPIDRRVFSAPGVEAGTTIACKAYYGLAEHFSANPRVAQSIAIWAEDWPGREGAREVPIAATQVIPADLSGWAYVPEKGQVAVDPQLGRMVFPPGQLPKRNVRVSYHYGFSADIGGGEYERPLLQPECAEIIRVIGKDQLDAALARWRGQIAEDGREIPHAEQPKTAVIEIGDSGVYVLPIRIVLGAGHSLQLRAAQAKRPVLRLLDWQTDLPDNLTVIGPKHGNNGKGEGEAEKAEHVSNRFALDGVMVAGRGVQIEGDLTSFTVRHSTLVPGWSLKPDCDPLRPSEPSIELIDSGACVVIEHSIVGSIQVNNDEVKADPVRIRVSDSIVDATGTDCERPECEAIGAIGARRAHAVLRVERSTLIGTVMAHAIEHAENSIFLGRVTVARSQFGCMRFCYVQPGSRTPKRFNCQPDGALRILQERLGPDTASSQAQALQQELDERRRVRPVFNSTRYGTPAYCQLAANCAPEILRGADDESEMGVFHDLFQPQRTANLLARLDEFVPAAADAGIIFST